MSTTHNVSQGGFVLRTLAMLVDTNANSDVFDGWLVLQIDIGGTILAKEIVHGRVVTMWVKGVTFLWSVAVGDVVHYYTHRVQRGMISISTSTEVQVRKITSEPIGQHYKVTEALSKYVAVDSEGKPCVLPIE